MENLKIPIKELKFSFSKSSGAGGQNVNKVNSKVTLKWNIEKTKYLSRFLKNRFSELFPRYLNGDYVVISSQRFRDQPRNVADCIEKLHVVINKVRKPIKKRVPTKVKKSILAKRKEEKQKHSEKKRQRSKLY